MVTILEKLNGTDLMASVEVNSDAEARIIPRFHGPEHYYVVAVYPPSLKAIRLHDGKNGTWGDPLGKVAVPEIGPRIRLTAAACGEYEALLLTCGNQIYYTPTARLSNVAAGKTGVRLCQIGDRQKYRAFELWQAQFTPLAVAAAASATARAGCGEYKASDAPSLQDGVSAFERMKP